MTANDCDALLRQLEYKLGWGWHWEIEHRKRFTQKVRVWLMWEVPDSADTTQTVTIENTEPTTFNICGLSKTDVMKHLLRAFDWAEGHETREFFMVGGEKLFDPHKTKEKTR